VSYDAIVIGAGVNGLVTANYLARAGQRVLVIEQRDQIGGTHSTDEIAPGFRIDSVEHDVGWFPPRIATDLGLASHGFQLEQSEVSVFTPLPDGRHLILGRDQQRTQESIAKHSARDAERWPAFTRRMARLAGFLEATYSQSPPAINSSKAADLFMLLGLGGKLRALGKVAMIDVLRTLPMAAAELLDDSFESDALKGTLGAAGITNIMQGPRSGGTAFVMLHHMVGSPPGQVRARPVTRGGVGSLAAALVAAGRARGVEVRTGARVERIEVGQGRVTGVALDNGEQIPAKRVVSGADPRRTLLELLDPGLLEPEFVRAVQNIKFKGIRAKVNLAVSSLPSFTALPGDGPHLRGAISISPSLDYLERAYDDAKHGRVSSRPYMEVRIPSLADPSLAPRGAHVVSIATQYAPYRLTGGWTDVRREALGDSVVAALAQYAPGLERSVVHRQVLTPRDIELRYGSTEGHAYQGELTLDQILFMRPVPGWSRYRAPVTGVYLCGSGTHPGGGIPGASGYNAAREILKDR
jgi:phytoene dehydrogenase-like protein